MSAIEIEGQEGSTVDKMEKLLYVTRFCCILYSIGGSIPLIHIVGQSLNFEGMTNLGTLEILQDICKARLLHI